MKNETLPLSGAWQLAMTDDFPDFLTAETLPGRMTFPATVPGTVQETLMARGVMDDPRTGLNSLRARWAEDKWWCYRQVVTLPDAFSPYTPATLCFDRLEMIAAIYVNGQKVGTHANAFRPARIAVPAGVLRPGGNTVAVLLESGVFHTADLPGAEYRPSPLSLLSKRHWLRGGQWQGGWDWQSRLRPVGITGDVRLEWGNEPRVTQVSVAASLSADLQTGTVTATVYVDNPGIAVADAELYLRVVLPGEELHGKANVVLRNVPSGDSVHTIVVTVEKPRLWYPVGHGEAYRYPAVVGFAFDGENCPVFTRHIGFRHVAVDQSPHPEKGFYFVLRVNNRPVFCKGGNWVPPDMIVSSVADEAYRDWVALAVEANFNTIRVWGGGVYAPPALMDACDEHGVLVWHDLLFACSKYPGDDPAFVAEVETETRHAMREMAHHPSLVVWCGNNEIEEGDWHWKWQISKRLAPHYALFHKELPRIAAREAAHVYYWISSPFSPDRTVSPRETTQGDQHPWMVSIGQTGGADWWEYRTDDSRFANEGGVLGCSTPATLRDFLPENERYLLSPSWEHHDNPFAINGVPGTVGRAYATVTLWTGLDPFTLDYERYAFVSGLLQAEGMTEYITNYRRRLWDSAAAIFWMFNDSWPATHGWTIADYYKRKKLSFHPVRRAFAPVSVIAHEDRYGETDVVSYTVINDTADEWHGHLGMGPFSVRGEAMFAADGMRIGRDVAPVRVLPNSRFTYQAGTRRATINALGVANVGALAVLTDAAGNVVAQHRVLFARFHELNLVRDPVIEMRHENDMLTLTSDVFCWGVCLDANGDTAVSDNVFDLLPGVPYRMAWDAVALGQPRIVRLGNRDALL